MPEPHIEEKMLERYAMRTAPPEMVPAIEEHLLECRECQSRLVQFDEFLAVFKKAEAELQREPAPRWNPFRFPKLVWIAPAAALAASLLFVVARPGSAPIPPAIVQMQALRGPESAAQVVAGKPALLVFDIAPADRSVPYRVEIVDRGGRPVLSAEPDLNGSRLSVTLRKLKRGVYWVRVYRTRPEETLLEEYALRAK